MLLVCIQGEKINKISSQSPVWQVALFIQQKETKAKMKVNVIPFEGEKKKKPTDSFSF